MLRICGMFTILNIFAIFEICYLWYDVILSLYITESIFWSFSTHFVYWRRIVKLYIGYLPLSFSRRKRSIFTSNINCIFQCTLKNSFVMYIILKILLCYKVDLPVSLRNYCVYCSYSNQSLLHHITITRVMAQLHESYHYNMSHITITWVILL